MKTNPIDILAERNTFAYHLQHPELSLDRYVRSKILDTADRVLARKIVYLDTRFWILLRDVSLGRAKGVLHEQILAGLRGLVTAGKVICPINADTLAELLKQRDATTRLATAKLIDELSLGVALQSAEERVGTELMHCVQLTRLGAKQLEPLERLVWTSPVHVLGHSFPTFGPLPEAERLACQKAFADYLWDSPLADQIAYLKDIPEELNGGWDAIADKLNREIKAHDKKVLPLNELHLHEFEGSLQLYLPTMVSLFAHLYEKDTGMAPPEAAREELEMAARGLIRILVESLRTGTIGRQPPSLIIRAGLHAGVRRNRGRQFTGNDLHDFGHATAALGYCDYFATDKSLRHLVINDLKFDERYEAVVTAEPAELLTWLDQI